MNRDKMLRNITIYKMYFVAKDPWFWGVILISSLINLAHMSLSEIYFMESVVMLGYVFFEIPSGALADYVGRKITIILGCACLILGTILFASMNSPFDAWCSNIIFMIGISFCSGADRALMSDSLALLNKRDKIKKIQGHAQSLRFLIVAFGSLSAGYLAEINLRLPLILCIPNIFLALILATFFTEPKTRKKEKRKIKNIFEFFTVTKNAMLSIWRLMIKSIWHVANNKKLKWIIVFFTLIIVSSKIWFFTYNPYFELVHLNYRHYGYSFFVLNIVACFFSYNSEKIGNKIGEKQTLNILYILVGIPILFMGTIISKFSVSMIVLQNVVRGLSDPLYIEMIDKDLTPENKATIQSISSAVCGLAEFIALTSFGIILGFFKLEISLQILGLLVLAIGILGMQKYKKIF